MRLIDTASAAYVLGCSVRQVQTLVKEGVLTNRSGRYRILLDVDEVYDYLTNARAVRFTVDKLPH